jgi:phosphoribosylaminoimidazolecarboxamide formyltransferase/IMP cyclohydrolase
MPGIQRALLSVSDKSGLVSFARGLADRGVSLLSTGGTARALRDAEIPVTDISEFTGFPEMLDGRVKTLHPKVHAGLLHLRDDPKHLATMQEHALTPIDLVCVNLYPFEQTVAKEGVTFQEAIENIDIGGPTLLRAAAKNMKFVTVVTDPSSYDAILEEMDANDGNTTETTRRALAQKAFARMAGYNASIASYLADSQEGAPRPFVMAYADGETLRYGENPHQGGTLYRDPGPPEPCIAHCKVLHGKAMSYNNYMDGDAALEAAKELSGEPGVAIIKHTNPCGYATGQTLAEAFDAAWAGDPVSSYGSVIAVTLPVDLDTAKKLKQRFIEVLIAPGFDEDALDFLVNKSKQIRLLKTHLPCAAAKSGTAVRQVNGGLLVQDKDVALLSQRESPTRIPFPEAKTGLAEFGMKACKHVKSNAIVLVREHAPGSYHVIGMGAGQPNRVDSVRKLALTKARDNIEALGLSEAEVFAESVLISDAFFPFPDNIHNAAGAGIRFVVEPGGSLRDDEVIAAADEHGIALLFTGMRHFRH